MKLTSVLIQSFKNWVNDDPLTQSAASAYYAIFSMPGLLIIIMTLMAVFFSEQRVETEVLEQIRGLLGEEAANNIHHIVNETQRSHHGIWAMIAGGVTLFFGATGLFAQLQRSLNRIWEVEVKKSSGFLKLLKNRLVSFGLILVTGFLLMISLTLTTAITVFSEWIAMQLSPNLVVALSFLNLVLSFLTVTALFTLIFKILPDAKVFWSVALLGGAISAVLFTLGQYAMNYYFEWVKPQSGFGAAGSIILMMLWVSYSCMILLIGGEFAKTYHQMVSGRKSEPRDIAKKKLRKS